jgi:prefoldin subunit 5
LRVEAASLRKKVADLEEANRRLRGFIEQLELEIAMLTRELKEMLEEAKTIQNEMEENVGGGVPIGRREEPDE